MIFDVLEEYKYTMILELSWLQKANPWINWTNHKLCFINKTYEIMDQPETPMWKPLYGMNEDQLQEVQEYVNKNLKQKFIKSSKSSAGYPVLFVSKSNGKKQLCVNYRHLNNITVQDSYSLFLIKEFQKCLRNTRWFTKLDLHKVYYWVWIKKDDKWKTAFRTRPSFNN